MWLGILGVGGLSVRGIRGRVSYGTGFRRSVLMELCVGGIRDPLVLPHGLRSNLLLN